MEKRKILFGITNVIAWFILIYCFYITYRISSAVSTPRYIVLTNELTHVIFRDPTGSNTVFHTDSETISKAIDTLKVPFHAYKLGSRYYNWVDFEDGGSYTLGDECEYGFIDRIFPSRLVMVDGTVVENTSSRSNRYESNLKQETSLPEIKPPI